MSPGFVHSLDPVLAEIGGLYLWWYGLAYTVGFLGIFLWLRHSRSRLGLTLAQVYDLSIVLALAVLIGARLVEVVFYEWAYYREHPAHIAAYWLGGMSTHGVLFGSVVGLWLFCRRGGASFLRIADELVIPAAFFMGVGRIGNFIDGQIVGAPAEVWWAVKFPDAEGFRHPVVLYDGVKNLLLVPLLLVIRRLRPVRGMMTAQFIFWYGFLRVFTDLFRDYRVEFLGLGPGQGFNLLMSVFGLALMVWCRRRPWIEGPAGMASEPVGEPAAGISCLKRAVLAWLVLFPMVIPSDWTQDVPARYGERHPGMEHSMLYPPIEQSPID